MENAEATVEETTGEGQRQRVVSRKQTRVAVRIDGRVREKSGEGNVDGQQVYPAEWRIELVARDNAT